MNLFLKIYESSISPKKPGLQVETHLLFYPKRLGVDGHTSKHLPWFTFIIYIKAFGLHSVQFELVPPNYWWIIIC